MSLNKENCTAFLEAGFHDCLIKATPKEMTASVSFPILIIVEALNGLITGYDVKLEQDQYFWVYQEWEMCIKSEEFGVHKGGDTVYYKYIVVYCFYHV